MIIAIVSITAKFSNGNLQLSKPDNTQSNTSDSVRIYSPTSDHRNASIYTTSILHGVKHSGTTTSILNGHSSQYLQQHNLIDSINGKDFDADRRLIGSSPSHPTIQFSSSSPTAISHKKSSLPQVSISWLLQLVCFIVKSISTILSRLGWWLGE